MLFDLQESLAVLSQRTYDVCVCGTGPAGITVARELASGGKKVALLEAGSFELSEQSQAQFKGTESGISTSLTALTACRLRYFGGTSNHWSGLCGLFDESDFWPTRHHDLPGWPIARAEVLTHLTAASAILDVDPNLFVSRPFVDSRSSDFKRPGMATSPPTRFGTKYRDEISRSGRIDLMLNANLVDLHLGRLVSDMPSVGNAIVSNYRNERARVVAKQYVLALGSIENARLLLNANKQLATGIGNNSDFVGRCFMEHLNVEVGRFVTNKPSLFEASNGLLSPTDATIRRLNVGNGILAFGVGRYETEAGRLGPVRGVLRQAACATEAVRDFLRRFKDFNCAGDGLITSLIEQAPNRDSRITLNQATDQFGLRQVNLHWVLSESDRRTVRSLGFALAKELVELDTARAQLNEFITNPKLEIPVWNHAHQMGTTRMSEDPSYGVVDANCKVHGVGNLYIAGSSVFPTGGGVNPTLTIVMLALRLATHLLKSDHKSPG